MQVLDCKIKTAVGVLLTADMVPIVGFEPTR